MNKYNLLNKEIKSVINADIDKLIDKLADLAYIQIVETMSPNDIEFNRKYEALLDITNQYIISQLEGENYG